MADNLVHSYNRRRVLAIDDLPDDDLLAIFDFYVIEYQELDFRKVHDYDTDYDTKRKIESWQSLVHVCRRWRCLVFVSPRRLNLQLFFIPRKYARTSLDVWPALPLLIQGNISKKLVGSVVAKLKHGDRISQINLNFRYFSTTRQVETLWTAMQVPFPELTVLCLSFRGSEHAPVLPDSFLGGSAPRLQFLTLSSIPFPGLPNLLLSTTHLVNLSLSDIPHSGYISPKAMVTCLSMLTSLEKLRLEFESLQFCPNLKSRRPFPPTRSVLPTLTTFWFKGVEEYLEELVARIEAPQLYQLSTTFFDRNVFDTPELFLFISCTPTLGAYDEAHLIVCDSKVQVRLQSHPEPSDHGMVEVTRRVSYRQLSSLAKICTFSLRLLLTMENLYFYDYLYYSPLYVMDAAEWLDLLLLFTAVKNLYLSKSFSRHIAPTLRELTGARTTEVLPALQNVFLEGFQPSEPVQEGISRFISKRQLTNHPVAISVWNRSS